MALISPTYKPDFLIIGAGIIGLSVALELKKQFSDFIINNNGDSESWKTLIKKRI